MARRRLAVLVLALVATACGRYLEAGAAVVDGVSIGRDALELRIREQQRGAQAPEGEEATLEAARGALANLIREELVRREAERRGVRVTPADVEAEIDSIRTGLGGEAGFQQALQRERYTLGRLRREVARSLLDRRLAEAIAGPVTDAQVREIYEREKDQFRVMKARHILFSLESRSEKQALRAARRTLARIRAGESFAALARELSDDPGSKQRGGDLGEITAEVRAGYDPSFGAALDRARVGVVTEPVRSTFGYHLILVTSRGTQPFREVERQLRGQLEGQKIEAALGDVVRERAAKSKIEVNPRYGAWDPETATIVPRGFFEPAEPEVGENEPAEGFLGPPPGG